MTTKAQREKHLQWLEEVTALPTAAGHEDRVIEWVEEWVSRRKNLKRRTDKAGNLIIEQVEDGSEATDGPRPVYITAHLDHPAFVVRRLVDEEVIELEFRGGVNDPYFTGATIEIFDDDDRAHRATIVSLDSKSKPFKLVRAQLKKPTDAIAPGQVGRWAFSGRDHLHDVDDKGLFHAHACDDLAAVAAALSVLDVLRQRQGMGHVGVLLTRAEEVGFIGAIAACKHRSVRKSSRLICLENSRSFAESPIGGGPIVRVGDRMSVFDPRLTNRISLIMFEHEKDHPEFRWQRKLMAGGRCEATTFSAYGYESTCLCLPLGNYHNMADIDGVAAGKRPAKVAPECIALDDYHGLVKMLIISIERLDDEDLPDLEAQMEALYDERGFVVERRR